MAKPTTKKKTQSPQERKAQHERERLRRLHELIESLGAMKVFRSLPKADRDMIEGLRAPRPVIADDDRLPQECVKYYREVLDGALAGAPVPMGDGGRMITLRDYFSVGMSLIRSQMIFKKEKHPMAGEWTRVLEPLLTLHEEQGPNRPIYVLLMDLRVSSWVFSDAEQGYFLPDMNVVAPRDKRTMPVFSVQIRFFEPEHRRFSLDDRSRTCFRVHAHDETLRTMTPCVLSTRLLPGQEDQPERSLPVYVQKHALHRLEERMKPYPLHIADHMLSDSIQKAVVLPLRLNTYLIEMRYMEFRIGYLVAEVVDEAVVLRTFLFITQSGTPEGDRFNEALRIGNYEKRWFELDCLSGFAHSDLCDDPRFKELLDSCGLADLTRMIQEELPLFVKESDLQKYGLQVRKILLEQSRFTVADEDS